MKDKVDILYIHPYGKQVYENQNFFSSNPGFELKDHNDEKYYSFIPMGLIGTLNKAIEKGYTVRGINLPLKKALFHADADIFISNYDAKMVIIDIHWYVHMKSALEIASLCRELIPQAQIVVGGMTATIFASQLVARPEIDFVVMGDSERPFILLAENLLEGKTNRVPNLASKKSFSPISYCTKDINQYNYLDIGFMEDSWNYMNTTDFWLLIAKGCSHNCTVCDGSSKIHPHIYSRKGIITRDPIKVASEINRLEKRTETVALSHDLDMLGKKFYKQLLTFNFDVGVRNEFFQLPDIKLIEKMSHSFKSTDLVFSPISGSDKERKKYGKNFSNKQFLRLLRQINKIDINGGIIVYFSDYMISQLKVESLDQDARESLIGEIKKIQPNAVFETQHQVIDPMVMIKSYNLDPDKVFKSLI